MRMLETETATTRRSAIATTFYGGERLIDTSQSLGKFVDYVWEHQDDYREFQ